MTQRYYIILNAKKGLKSETHGYKPKLNKVPFAISLAIMFRDLNDVTFK